jgi:capsule biosynthesis phosphatase
MSTKQGENMNRVRRLIIDLDNTLTIESSNPYDLKEPNIATIEKVRKYKLLGFQVVIHTARNMRTFERNIGEINVHTLPKILTWLDKHQVPYDEVIVGKPWCGDEGFYVDDRAIRPDEFVKLSLSEIHELLGHGDQ